MVPELHVTDIAVSLSFWSEMIGFAMAYQRMSEKFAYLERPDGAQVMLCQRHGRYETGPMQRPLGQGVMLQIYVNDIAPILAALSSKRWPLYQAPREMWRQVGADEGGQREFFVQDPDGYLLMIAQDIGLRGATASV
jgi:catechol 2,3-dioxygenase-like lactoylglutathione lyase family enzyme